MQQTHCAIDATSTDAPIHAGETSQRCLVLPLGGAEDEVEHAGVESARGVRLHGRQRGLQVRRTLRRRTGIW